MFDPQLQAANVEGQEYSESYVDRIDQEFSGLLSDVEETREEDNLGPLRKKVKLSRKSTRRQRSSEHSSADDIPSTSNRKTKKKSVGFELARQMRDWQEERRLARLNPEIEVMDKIKEYYSDQIAELSFVEYGRLASLLRQSHPEYGNYTGAEYFQIMDDEKNPQFRDQLMEKWFEFIQFPGPSETNTLPPLQG